MSEDLVFKAAVSFCFGVIVSAIVSFLLKPFFERRERYGDQLIVFRVFTRDVVRHVILSLAQLYRIRRGMKMEIDNNLDSKRIFRFSHLQKLSLAKDSEVFTESLYQNTPPDVVGELHHLKLRIRNIEIDIEEAKCSYILCKWDDANQALERLISQLESAKNKLYDTLQIIEPCYKYYKIHYENLLKFESKRKCPEFVDFQTRLRHISDKEMLIKPKPSSDRRQTK